MLQRLLSTLGMGRVSARTTAPRPDVALLEAKLRSTPKESRAPLYNQLGDLHVKAGNPDRALASYGQAVDVYLETGYFGPAAALCRKMIALQPNIVRARCTLAFLSLGDGLVADAEREIADYVRAAQRIEGEALAITRLRMMADATDDHELRMTLGNYLTELGDAEGANEVFGAVFAERNGLRPTSYEDQRERWARLLRVTISDPAFPQPTSESLPSC